MPRILSIGTYDPPIVIEQSETLAFAAELFKDKFQDLQRLLGVFDNSLVEQRHVCMPVEWYREAHSLSERNDLYIKFAVDFSIIAIENCLADQEVAVKDIDAIFFVSTTGMATPSIEARIMNRLDFESHTKRIPIWGLGCAGGAAGVARASEYCRLFPNSKVLLIALELCSLTFQPNDFSKSNLIATSLFADGVACVLIVGDDVNLDSQVRPNVIDSQSTLMPDSERVMGWDILDNGLFVVFSRDIPDIIRRWLKQNVEEFLSRHNLTTNDIKHFVAHPGGRKVLEAYEDALALDSNMTLIPRDILRTHGNMSSPSALYVLQSFMKKDIPVGERGLITALGPGFSSELVLLEWS